MTAGSIFASYTSKDKSYLNKLKEAGKVDNIWEFK